MSIFEIGSVGMDRKNRACWNCVHYTPYYTKGLSKFERLDYGFCRNKKGQAGKHDQCGYWKNALSTKAVRENLAKRKLNEVLDELIEIKQILLEEENQDDSLNQ